jgi:hypothetical protein
MRGSKHWRLVREVLLSLHLIKWARLPKRVLLIKILVSTIVQGRLELGVKLDARWGWDE